MDWSALFTVWLNGSDLLGAEVLSPSYDALMEWPPALRLLVVKEACPLASRATLPSEVAPSKNVTAPVGVLCPPLVTVAVMVTICPYCDGLALDISVVVVLAVKLISSTGCSSMPLGATPVCPWMKSKKPTPLICTGTCTAVKNVVGVKRASNLARAAATPGPNGLPGATQAGDGISATIV